MSFSFRMALIISCGVAILVRKSLDFKLTSLRVDNEGRYLILEAIIQDTPFLLINIYAPNKTSNQSSFFLALPELISLEELRESNYKFLIGGDFNVALQPSLDCSGGNTTLKESVKFLEDLLIQYDLVDIWRVRNPKTKKFTWHQRKTIIQRRLDYWFISDLLQDDVAKIDIITSIKTDHSAIVLEEDSMADPPRGPSFWKFNNSLLDDPIFVQSMRVNFPLWLEDINFCQDLRIKWDYIKYKIRQDSIKYSKVKASSRKTKISQIEGKLKACEEKVAEAPSPENLESLEACKTAYEREYDYMVRGSIIRPRARWYEQCKRNTKYLFP